MKKFFVSLKNRYKKKTKKLKKHIKKTIKQFDRNVVFSIGENCLADDILARNQLKSFSSPYSFGRSNIEYILLFENEDFADFLNKEYLMYEKLSGGEVPRNKKYVETENKYHNSCTNGFEFTHHDVIASEKSRDTLKRRYQRLRKLKNKNIIMLYHHRVCQETDESLLISHLQDLAKLFETQKNKVNIFLFYQILISDETQRRVEHFADNNINVYKFYTLNAWAGDDENLLWARCDNDLLEEMIHGIKEKMHG